MIISKKQQRKLRKINARTQQALTNEVINDREILHASPTQIRLFEKFIQDGAEKAHNAIGYASINPNIQYYYMTNSKDKKGRDLVPNMNVQSGYSNHQLFDLDPDPIRGKGLVLKEGKSVNKMFSLLFTNKPRETGAKYYLDCADFCQLLLSYAYVKSGIVYPDANRFSFSQHSGSLNPIPSETAKVTSIPADPLSGFSKDIVVIKNILTKQVESSDSQTLWNSLPIGTRIAYTNRRVGRTSDHRSENCIKISDTQLVSNGFNGGVSIFSKDMPRRKGYYISEFATPAFARQERTITQAQSLQR